ncbi:MAG: hypothetical protein QF599_02950 [Planctomycetota bacterium]|nr:hypothetical protein [Planctomycetota bacterium]
MIVLPLLLAMAPIQDTPTVGGVPYRKLATRTATEAAVREQVLGDEPVWGDWQLLSGFPFGEHAQGELAQALEPERNVHDLRHGGRGPDLTASYTGKQGFAVGWRELGDIANRRVDLHVHQEDFLQDNVLCYLWSTVTVDEDQVLPITTGSDDGMRFWLNGELLVDIDVGRGLDSAAHSLQLDLKAGVNHIFVKVSEGQGGWDFQINCRVPLPPRIDAELTYRLDRDFPSSPVARYWQTLTYPIPDDELIEVGGLAFLADGRPLVATRRGDVFLIEGAYGEPPLDARFMRFAEGLHEPLGLAARQDADGEAVYTVQRGELTRLMDRDGDDRADLYQTFCDDWGVSGNYHEFAFGPKFDGDGNAWVTLNVGFCGALGKAVVPWRGWAVKISPAGVLTPVCDGLRSPNGIGQWTDGEMFYLDNQGDFIATNRLSHLKSGAWHGHPASLRWREGLEGFAEQPERQPASVWFPYRVMGQSTADLCLDDTGGAFGPFSDQFLVGDQMNATVMRAWLEEVEGHYQGGCAPFLAGFQSGVNRMAFAPDGSLLVGMTDRGWGSVGSKTHGVQRVVFTGGEPFDLARVSALATGFVLEFSAALDEGTATNPESYVVRSHTYEYHADYGAPEEDHQDHPVLAARMLDEHRVELTVAELRAGFVHRVDAGGVVSATGAPPLFGQAWYTLINIPGAGPRQWLPGAGEGPAQDD